MRRLFIATLITAAFAGPAFAEDAAPTTAPNKNTLARVEGQDITKKDVEAFVDKLPSGAKGLPAAILQPMALDQMINDRLLTKAANEDKLAESKEYQKRLAEIKEQLLRETYLQSKIEKRVTDDAVRAEFDKVRKENPEQTEYQARHMLVDSKETAEALIKQVNSGADFTKLASENNKGPEKAKGGELGYFTAKEVVPEFGEALAKMKKGSITPEPIKTQFGWHVIKLEDKRTRPAPKFEAVKEQLRQRVQQNLVKEEIENLRKDARVEIFQDNLPKMPKGEK